MPSNERSDATWAFMFETGWPDIEIRPTGRFDFLQRPLYSYSVTVYGPRDDMWEGRSSLQDWPLIEIGWRALQTAEDLWRERREPDYEIKRDYEAVTA